MWGFGRALFIKSQDCALTILSPPSPRSSPCHLLRCKHSAETSPQIPSEREAAGANAMKLLHWCPHSALCFIFFFFFKAKLYALEKKDRARWSFKGLGFQWGSQATKVQQHNRCLAAAWLSWGGGGGGSLTCQRVRGWLKDSASPFQLQQLPIYIVMQIHGLSQMVLFQHRGCIEIWLFIPSTSQVFNAPSSVCFHPFPFSWQPFGNVRRLMCLSPAVAARKREGVGVLGRVKKKLVIFHWGGGGGWQGSSWEITGKQERNKLKCTSQGTKAGRSFSWLCIRLRGRTLLALKCF